MNNKKNGIPKLRFPGFTGAWEQRKLGEVFDTVTDYVANGSFKSLRDNVKSYTKENYAYMIRLQDASNNWKGPWLYTDEAGYSFLTKSKLHPNDIIMSNVGSVGKFFLIPELDKPMTLAPNAVLIKSSKNNALFLYQMMISTPMQVAVGRKTTPGVQLKINKTDFKRIQTNLPSLNEQEKIGEFFKQLDSLIALHQRKLEHLQEQKKGLLQKMFPKNGEVVPEVRFPGFTDAWEQRKLGEITSVITKGTTPLDKSGKGSINFVKVEDLSPDNSGINVHSMISKEEHEGRLKRSILKENDILFSIAGTLGRIGIVKSEILPANTNQALAIVRLKEGNLSYISTVLEGRTVREYIRQNPTVGAQPNLSLKQVSELRISFPTLQEQEQVGNFFNKLNSFIALHQRKLEHLELMKKGLLQQMFV